MKRKNMEKFVTTLICILFVSIKVSTTFALFEDVPKFIVKDGNLIIESAIDKNITIRVNGRSWFNVNDINVLKVIGAISKMTRTIPGTNQPKENLPISLKLSNLRSTLFGEGRLEERILMLENATMIAPANFNSRRLMRRLRRLENKINQLADKGVDDNCRNNPCQNGGFCIDLFDRFVCRCLSNWEGETCGVDVNECAEFAGTAQGCQNGAQCVNTPGSFSCVCSAGWVGIHCTQRYADCMRSSAAELCDHGTCVNVMSAPGYTCLCQQGWKTNGLTPACSVDINECEDMKPPCVSQCINLPGSFMCGPCPAGYTGNGFSCRDINECEVNNGGCSTNPKVACINSYGSYHCGECPIGWTGYGKHCTRTDSGTCSRNICHPAATCREISNVIVCTCPPGMNGDGIGPNGCTGDPCANRCLNGGTCILNGTSYSCVCPTGLLQPDCRQPVDPCRGNPCLNGGTCVVQNDSIRRYRCLCPPRFRGRICQSIQTRCGGVLTEQSGTLKYPLTPNYQHNVRCAWLIRTNFTKVIEVTFTKFDLESSVGCMFDWLQIHDGGGSAAQLVGRFCGSELPKGGKIISTHNRLYFWFRSDNSTAHNGFELNWRSISPVCGGVVIASTHGTIASPGSPGNYPPNRDCEWIVKAPDGKRIQLTFFVMALESHDDCGFDFLAVYNGASRESPLIQKFCSTWHPSPLISTGNRVTLHFHSDADNTDAGFQIHYALIEGYPGCGGIFTAPKGSFTSPKDGETYPPNLNCDFLIKLPIGNRIKLHFTEFAIEYSEACDYDYVEIFDGETEQDPKVNRFCGLNLPSDIASESNALLLKFITDYSDTNKGFTVQYETICGGKFSEPEGIITSPMYPKPYTDDRTCFYEITAPLGKAIQLNFQDFDVEDYENAFRESNNSSLCSYDLVEIIEGVDTASSYRFCGAKIPPPILSKSNVLTIKFIADESISGRGFKANYSFIDIGCGGILKEPHLIIKPPVGSEFNSARYKHNADCEWIIAAPLGYLVYLSWLSFELEQTTECLYDYVELYDNESKVGRYCGANKPPAVTSSTNILKIKFVSDESESGEEFMATYHFIDSKKVCGGNYFSASGVLRSPDYPSEYPANKDCVWTISVPSGSQIELTVKVFDLEVEPRCQYDYLEIRNGLMETSPLIGVFCGKDIPKRIPSFSNHLYLKFISDYSSSGAGFEIEWDGTITGCGGKLTTYRGSITSPNYPSAYYDNAQCDWRIVVSKGSKIDILIPDLQLEVSTVCFYDYLEVFESFNLLKHKLGRYCSSFNDIIHIQTRSNEALVRFVTDQSQASKGFQLSYSTNCNNELSDLSGVIESPNFPNPYPPNVQCKWTIKGRRSSNIVVHISHLDVEQVYEQRDNENLCPYDYLELSQKKGTRFELMKRICTKPDDPFKTSSEVMQIVFRSDESEHARGFRLEYQIEGCGGMLNRPMGVITSPNYPKNYPHKSYCEWIIQAEYGHLIELNITDIQIENIGSCGYDGLLIANGQSAENKIATHCGQDNSSVTLRSNGNNLFLQFYSDESSSGRGFRAVYRTIEAKCGGIFKGNLGAIHSPNYPQNYDSNLDCQWLVQVDEQNSIRFEFTEFDLEMTPGCVNDRVEIYDGTVIDPDNLMLMHCGGSLPNITVNSTKTNSMLVILKTNSEDEYKGFALDYSMNCGKRIYANDTGNVIMKAGNKDTECIWTIVTEPGEHITFTTTHFERSFGASLGGSSESCDDGGVTFFDGDSIEAPMKAKYCGKFPKQVVTQGSALTIRVEIYAIAVFEGYYSVYASACGGSLKSLSGEFASPLYPNSYPVNVQCIWTIEITPGNRRELTIEEIDIENSVGCNEDYLEVRNDGPAGELLGVFCGNQPPSIVNSQGRLWLKFKSNEDDVGKGFIARYTYATNVDLAGMNGTITSPRYPDIISTFERFHWRVTVPPGNVIEGTFPDGRGEQWTGFHNQEFLIYNGYDETAVPLELPFEAVNFISSTGSIYIDSVVPWFKLDWRAVSKNAVAANSTTNSTCQSDITIGQNIYLFNSPGFPFGYDSNLNCYWIFRPEKKYMHPSLSFIAVDIDDQFGCYGDSITVSSSGDLVDWKKLETLCKMETNSQVSYEGAPFLKVTFQSDFFGNKTGFSAMVTTKCGGALTEPSGEIDSSFFENLSTGSKCEWQITVQRGRKIQLEFTKMAIVETAQNICQSYVMLKNGGDDDSPILGDGKYCGTKIPTIPLTSSNKVYIKYVNNFPSGNWGLTYKTVMNQCGYSVSLTDTKNSTVILTPNFPNIPTPHMECSWIILAPPGEHLQVHFEKFDLTRTIACDKEYVIVRDGATDLSTPLAIFCNQPNSIDTTSNAMRITYFTDTPDPLTGFNATVSIGKCGGTYHQRRGVITSKNYPNLGGYPSNSVCEYRIVLPIGTMINITFIDIHLPTGDCAKVDHLAISYATPGIENVTESLEYNMCGSFTLPYLVVNNNEVILRFYSNQANFLYRGFKLSYASTRSGCGGDIHASQGVITTPGYPSGWGNVVVCIWRLTVPRGRKVRLEFLDFDVPKSTQNGTHSAFLPRMASTRIGLFNDHRYLSIIGYFYNTSPSTIYSSDNQMLISCWLSPASGFRGIKMSFNSDEPTICTGSLNEQSGSISLPASNQSFICTYDTKINAQETISMAFHNINFPRSFLRIPCVFRPPIAVLDGLRTTGSVCENTTEISIRSPFLNTKLRLIQTIANRFLSFNMIYKRQSCGGTVLLNGAYNIVSPLVLSNQTGSVDCAWYVTKENRDSFLFKVSGSVKFKLACDKEYISISKSPTGPHLGRFCGDKTIANISGLTKVFIEYHSDEFNSNSNLNLTVVELDDCGDHEIAAPYTVRFGKGYKSNVECIWRIYAKSGYHLKAEFVDRFYIEESEGCSKDYLAIFNYEDMKRAWKLIKKVCGRNTPPSFRSDENKLRLEFRSDSAIEGDGFSVRFDNVCGGIYQVSADDKSMTSPNYPDAYVGNLECNYTLVAPKPESTIVVQFTDFQIESIGRCRYDNVTVYKVAYNNQYEKVDTYCVPESLSELRFTDRMSIVFRTDSNGHKKGFKFNYSLSKCGGVITNRQLISSPKQSKDNQYPPNENCYWNITAPSDKHIVIKFEEFELEYTYQCYYDYVKVYKGSKELDQDRIATLCGNLTGLGQLMTIDNNQGLIHFHSDLKYFGRGFSAWILFKKQCDQRVDLTEANPSYRYDKFYGSSYEVDLICNLVVSAPDGYHIRVEFEEFHVELCNGNLTDKCCDYLELRDGAGQFSELIERYCGHQLPPSFMSTRTKLFAQFVSDSVGTSSGIKAIFSIAKTECGATNYALENTQGIVIQTPGETHPPNLRCHWKFTSSKYQLHVHFLKFDLQEPDTNGGCSKDVLQIYNEDSAHRYDNGLDQDVKISGAAPGYPDAISRSMVGRYEYCGNHIPEDIYSITNTVYVAFKSSGQIQKTGVKFIVAPTSGCHKNYTGTQGRIMLNSYLDCEFYILALANHTISIYFLSQSFLNDNCESQYFAIYDGDTGKELSKKCGQLEPSSSFFSNTNHLKIKIKNAEMHSSYDATFIASKDGQGCGGQLQNYGGIFTSPFYPINSRNDSDCRWDIQVPNNMQVALVFNVFDLGAKTTCRSDYLQIIEPKQQAEEVVRQYCGEDKPSIYRGRGNRVSVRYRKTVNFDGTGWVLRFGAVHEDTKLDGE